MVRVYSSILISNKKEIIAGHWWLTLIILITWEVEMGRVVVQGQLMQKIHETPPQPIKAGIHLSSQICWKFK
jgi:hypothetical protein